jgi:uncharacterized repeat protein (TIGR01451 family)
MNGVDEMRMRRIGSATLRIVVSMVLALGSLLVLRPQPARANGPRPFEPLFHTQANGAIAITGNALLSCHDDPACTSAMAGTNPDKLESTNNGWWMTPVDTDTESTTTSSSSADLALPAGAEVLYAGLFWGADEVPFTGGLPAVGDPATMKLKVPGGGYEQVTAQRNERASDGRGYSSSLDITDLVRKAGNGTYWGADVPAATGNDRMAGWSLVIAYSDPKAPLRDLTVFNGYQRITRSPDNTTGKTVDIGLSGFLTPPKGAVGAKFGMVTYEGDAGRDGDYFAVNGTKLSDPASPADNFFDSAISADGKNLTNRNPASVNNLGLDAKMVNAPGVLPNGATSATLTFGTTGDSYQPTVLTTQIDLYAPTIIGAKSVRNLTGPPPLGLAGVPDAKAGDQFEYTVSFSNSGADDAVDGVVHDELPPNTTYVPSSLRIGGTAMTDQASDDQAEYDASSRQVRYRVGGLGIDDTVTVTFRVTADTAAAGTTLRNTAKLDYRAETIGKNYTAETPEVSTSIAEAADVELKKSAPDGPLRPGTTFTYNLLVTNKGPNTATGVNVVDPLPKGLEPVSATSTVGLKCLDGRRVGCYIGQLTPGAEAKIAITVRIPEDSTLTTLTNTATVTTGSSDPDLSNNTDSADSEVKQGADLALEKSVSTSKPAPGEIVTFDLKLTNKGPSAAHGVQLTDRVPEAFTVTEVTAPDGTSCVRSGGDITCTTEHLAAGAERVVKITARLDSGYRGGELRNTAQVIGETPELNEDDNTDMVTVTPADPVASLVVSKVSEGSPSSRGDAIVAGEVGTYRIAVHNDGPSDARDVHVRDVLPEQFSNVTAQSTAGTCAVVDRTVDCNLGELRANSTATVTVTAKLAAGATGDVRNTATATSPDDPTPGTDTVDTAVRPFADLHLTKTADSQPDKAGGSMIYRLGLANSGPSTAHDVTITDPLPAPLTVVSASTSKGSCDRTARSVSCHVGAVAPGEVVTVLVTANVPADRPDSLDNTAKVESPTDELHSEDNTATYTLIKKPQADVSVTKTADPTTVVAGETVSYKLTVHNDGPGTAPATKLVDTVPDSIGHLAVDSRLCHITGQKVVCDRSELAAGETFTVTVVGTVAGSTVPGILNNTATVTTGVDDPTESNNTVTTPITVTTRADLSITKTGPDRAYAGSAVEYSVRIRNAGPSDATGVVVTDTMPDGVRFTSGSGPGGDCVQDKAVAPAVVRCPVGRLAAYRTQTLVLHGVVEAGAKAGTSTNQATVTADTPDSAQSNNTATEDTEVLTDAHLSVTKVATPDEFVAGREAVYTVKVANSGPSTAKDVRLTDPLAAGLTLVDATTAHGSCTSGSGGASCQLGTVEPKSSAEVLIRVQVAANAPTRIVNVATATSPTDPGEHRGVVSTTVGHAADLSLSKSFDQTSVVPGGGTTFRLTVTNHGPSAAHGVTIKDTMPAGLRPLSVEPADRNCRFHGSLLSCDGADLEPGATDTLLVTATLDPEYEGSSITNHAVVESGVPDPDPSDNTATATVPVMERADLQVLKEASVAAANPGEKFHYLLAVRNYGPGTAHDVTVTDRLPAGLTGLSAITEDGHPCAIEDGEVRCALGDLPVGQYLVGIEVQLAADYAQADVTNVATAHSSTPDADPGDESGTSTIPILPATPNPPTPEPPTPSQPTPPTPKPPTSTPPTPSGPTPAKPTPTKPTPSSPSASAPTQGASPDVPVAPAHPSGPGARQLAKTGTPVTLPLLLTAAGLVLSGGFLLAITRRRRTRASRARE